MPEADRIFAICQWGGCRFAIDAKDVVQAIPRPLDVLELPEGQTGRTPVFMLRGQVMPLLDLQQWLTPNTSLATQAPEKVMVLRNADRWVAIGIHELVGMQRAEGTAVVPLRHNPNVTEVFHSVLLPAGSSGALPLPLLDTPALLQLTGVWGPSPSTTSTVDNAVPATSPVTESTTTSAEPPKNLPTVYAWLMVSSQNLLVEARWLASVEPMPPLQRVTGRHPDNLGIAVWRGRDLQVLQLTELLGTRSGSSPPLMAIFTDGERYMGLAVDEARHLETQNLSDLQSPDAGGMRPHPALLGLLYHPNGQRCLVLNALGLLEGSAQLGQFQHHTHQGLGRVGADAKTSDEMSELPAHIVFQGGTQWALGIDQIEALTENPDHIDPPSPNANPAMLGSFAWRGRSIPIWDLKHLSQGQPTSTSPQCRVVLVRQSTGLLGLLTEQLLMLLPARQGTISTVKQGGGPVMKLITVQREQRAQSFRVLAVQEHLPPQG